LLSAFLRDAEAQGKTVLVEGVRDYVARKRYVESVKDALRAETGNPALENRSIRRGALQAMALAGASEKELMLFSRHATPAMLRRYLGFGRDRTAEAAVWPQLLALSPRAQVVLELGTR
jgi:hypothetical protein